VPSSCLSDAYRDYYLPLSPDDSPRATSPVDDYTLEAQFCRDFFCCNIKLPNLHDLIQHYEERHVKFEDEHGLLDESSAHSTRVNSPVHAAKHAAEASAALADIYSVEVGSMSQLSADAVSAFETAIIRNAQNPRKRKVSMNAHEPASNRKCLSSFVGIAGLSAEELDEHLQRAIAYSYDAASHANSTYSSSENDKSPWLIRSNAMEPTLAVQPFQMNAVAAAAAAAVVSEVGGPTIVMPMPPSPAVPTVGRPALLPMHSVPGLTGTPEKPYRCEVPGCDKTYKNKNGLKYHILNGHIDPALKEAASQERKQQRLEERANRFTTYYPPQQQPMPAPQQPVFARAVEPLAPSAIIDVVTVQPDVVPASGLLTPPTPSSPRQLAIVAPSQQPKVLELPTPVSTTPSTPVEEVFKPYKCAVTDCGKMYKNLGGLKYHIDKVHDGNPLALAVGRKKFPSTPTKPSPSASSSFATLAAGLFVRVPEAVPHLQQKPTASLLSSTNIIGAGMLPAPLPNNHTTTRMSASYPGKLQG
jgi:transcription factor SFP1